MFGSNKARGPIRDSPNRLKSPMSEGREPLGIVNFYNIYNKPCQCRDTGYWADDTLGINSPSACRGVDPVIVIKT